MEHEPRASRPRMGGYGVPHGSEGMLPWDWARERLTKSHNYWLTTSRADGVPHTMPVWGLWLAGAWYFSTFSTSRKARNLAENPHCVVCNDNAEEAVILEGVAQPIPASEIPQNAPAEYKAKYGWELQGSVFKVQPRVVFAMPEKQFPGSVTRWNFA
jgi:nitroimidazol reductase NimA-like FMN-containing flavoprotein (pyridoxamine 5'-phosphate oxidase superfamily)